MYLLLIALLSQAPSPAPNPSLIRVFVATDQTGAGQELADRRTSVKDLAAALAAKKKSLVIVESTS
jgi:hypothetical protein